MSHLSHPTRHSILPSHQPHHPSTSTHTTALQTRIAAKRTELSSLIQLRDLSSQLASQMTELETKLSTLNSGTESVAAVMANWGSVLGVIGMVGREVEGLGGMQRKREEEGGEKEGEREEQKLPVTLVRIPVVQNEQEGEG